MEQTNVQFIADLHARGIDKLYLLDTSWLLHRSHHTFAHLSCNIGGLERPSGHLYGVLRAVMDIKRKDPRSAVVLCLDRHPSNRHSDNEDYKAGRPKMAYNIYQDEADICTVASLIPEVYYAYGEGLEADDIMFSLAKEAYDIKEWKKLVYIFSGDNDLLQAIRKDTVYVLRKFSSSPTPKNPLVILDYDYVKEEYGVDPVLLPLYRAVVGDPSDNLKGVPRFPKDLLRNIVNQSRSVQDLVTYKPRTFMSSSQHSHILRLKENEELISRNFKMMRLTVQPHTVYRDQDDPQYVQSIVDKWKFKSVVDFCNRF